MSKEKLVVGDWHQKPSARKAVATSEGHDRTPFLIGIFGTLIVHLFVLQSLQLLGYHATKAKRPVVEGLGATSIKSDAVATDTLILIKFSQISITKNALYEVTTSVGMAPSNTIVTVLSQNPMPHVDIPSDALTEDKDAPVAGDIGDPAERAALFGRYTGQIDARVERAWRRPRSPVNPVSESQESAAVAVEDRRFECRIRTTQDANGNVQDVKILTCNGTEAWQQSLVSAIRSASPLPAPPNPSVFSRTLTMTFSASAYAPGASVDEYE